MVELALSPRSVRRLERREAIISAALATVVARGVDSLSMNKLAKEVGFTPGALYRYFDSKDALVAEIAERVLDDLLALLSKAGRSHETDAPLARLWAFVDAYVAFSREDAHAFGFLSLLLAHPQVLVSSPEHVAHVNTKLQLVATPIVEALLSAQAEGELTEGDTFERALALFAAVQGALQLRKQERHDGLGIQAERLVHQLVATLLLGWGAKGVTP
jgi:AcrR family transcriptional regulator